MSSPRFFIDQILVIAEEVVLPTATAHYAMRVLRLRNGDPVVLFNGRGGEFSGSIFFNKKEARVEVHRFDARDIELPMAVTLIQALPSGDKMDWIIEKATELGVQTILPVFSERSIIRLDGTKSDKKQEQWSKIAQSACEQCGRNTVPMIGKPQTIEQVLQQKNPQHEPIWWMDPQASHSWHTSLQATTTHHYTIAIGPEGGWSPKEIALAQRQGAQLVHIGERVLRTETASLFLLSSLQTYWALSH